MRRVASVFCFMILSLAATAQKGDVIVVKDPQIDSIIAHRLELSRKAITPNLPAAKPSTAVVSGYGYRVQVFYGSDRREVFSQQARFKAMYQKYNAYITYKEPNYYLRVGDFRTRLEAQAFLNELKPSFPTLFIFREKINAPELDK